MSITIDLQIHSKWNISEQEYLTFKSTLPDDSTFYNVVLSIFNNRLKNQLEKGYYLETYNTFLNMFEAFYEEKQYKKAMLSLIKSTYITLSGMNNTGSVDDFKKIFSAPFVENTMIDLKDYYDDTMVDDCYNYIPLPFHYFKPDTFKNIINDIFKGEKLAFQKYAQLSEVVPIELKRNINSTSIILFDLIHDFVAIDFETANEKNNSACSIGLVEVKDDKIVNEYYSLIKPPIIQFNPLNVNIHGITENDVKNAPTFGQVWEEIKHYFNGKYILTAYNAAFDMQILRACLDEYKIIIPDFDYFCTMRASSSLLGKNLSSKLSDRCEYFNISLCDAHNALCDCEACANVAIKLFNFDFENKRQKNKFLNKLSFHAFSELKPSSGSKFKNFNKVNIHDIERNENIQLNELHPFYEKNIVFTGDFSSMSKKEAMQKAIDTGAILKSGVSKTTHYLVYGIQDKKIVGNDGLSTKQKKAMELINQGIDIKIIDESQFLELINEG